MVVFRFCFRFYNTVLKGLVYVPRFLSFESSKVLCVGKDTDGVLLFVKDCQVLVVFEGGE